MTAADHARKVHESNNTHTHTHTHTHTGNSILLNMYLGRNIKNITSFESTLFEMCQRSFLNLATLINRWKRQSLRLKEHIHVFLGMSDHCYICFLFYFNKSRDQFIFNKLTWANDSGLAIVISRTVHCLSVCPFTPLIPSGKHAYIILTPLKNIIFLILLKNIDCGYSLESPRRGGSNEYP